MKKRKRQRVEGQRAWSKTKEQFWSFQSNDNDGQGTVTINGNFKIVLNHASSKFAPKSDLYSCVSW